jgi:hypothetical protein
MRTKWWVLVALAALSGGYVGYPYVTLYRLGTAMRQADPVALREMVDWDAVREGLKEDICDMVLDEPSSARPDSALPPFGESFVRGIAGNVVDQTVTPETIVALTQTVTREQHANAHVEWAFFENLTHFGVNVVAGGVNEPVRMTMELHEMRWRVRRIWLPARLLERTGFRT